MLDELRDVQAVSECMVCMNGDRHRAPPFCLCNFSESDPRSGIIMGKVPGVRDGREIEPRKHEKRIRFAPGCVQYRSVAERAPFQAQPRARKHPDPE